MSKLHPDAAALLRAGRTAFRPGASDRDRVLQSLSGVLDAGAAHEGARPAEGDGTKGAARPRLSGWLAGSLAAIAISAGVLVAWHPWTRTPASKIDLRDQSAVAPPPAVPAAAEVVSSAVPPSTDIAPAAEPSRIEGAGRPTPRIALRSASHRLDSLPEEVRLLSRAEQQLNEGLAGDALKTLTEHEQRFPAGALAEERVAARVQALCILGRTAEARSELAKLMRAYPRSPHLDRARKICGNEVDSNASP
jgi:hypothetical protein